MATPNPHFDPEWRALRDHHHEERSRAGDELRRLCEAGEIGSAAYEATKAAWERHNAAWKATYKKQYATVEEYAAWLFGAFPPGNRGRSAGIAVPETDLASFGTVEEADAAWSRINGAVDDAAEEKQLNLPVGQPEGLKAFANPKSPRLVRFWRYFRARDLYSAGGRGEVGVRTFVTVDEQADGWHVCFMQDNIGEIGNVAHSIERLATVVYYEACAHSRPWTPRRSGLFTSLADRFARRRRVTALDPYRFHFYQHIPPGKGRREAFDRVALGFELDAYRNPEWLGYRSIPELIQSGRHSTAPAGNPARKWVLRYRRTKKRSDHDRAPFRVSGRGSGLGIP